MPAPLTLAQVRASFTLDEATDELIDQLDSLGFSATSWQEGSVQRTIVVIMAFVYWKLREFIASISYFAFNSSSSGDALTSFSDSHYDNQRVTAVAAQHTCVLTGGAVGPPHTVVIDQLVASDGTLTFRNKTAGTVPASGTLSLTFECETLGADGNVANGTITTLQTPLAGVTINNPDPGTGTSITRVGADAELDAALQLRNSSKWSTLDPVTAIADRYEYTARTVVANCRVAVDDSNPGGPGTIYVYIAADDGVATSGEQTLVDNAIDAAAFGGTHTVYIATADALAITATIYYDPDYTSSDVEDAVDAAVETYINAAPIGGYDYSPGPSAVIDRDGLLAAIRAVDGVEKVSMTVPSADFSVTAYHVATAGTHSWTMTAVTA